jgi:hypothetical protein
MPANITGCSISSMSVKRVRINGSSRLQLESRSVDRPFGRLAVLALTDVGGDSR